MNKYAFIIVFALFLFATVATAQAQCWNGTVVTVVDGNTLLVKRKHTRLRVRLYGVNAPALGQTYATEAKNHLQGLVLNNEITVCPKKTPGGSAFEVHVLKGFMKNVNYAMVRKGFARSTVAVYKNLEKSAREKKLGLWADKNRPQTGRSRKQGDALQRAGVPQALQTMSAGALSVYKVHGAPQPLQVPDNSTQNIESAAAQQRQLELDAIRKKELERVSDTRLSHTDIQDFKLKAHFHDADNESNAGLQISFYYWSTVLDSPVDWNDGDVNCECRVIGHFSEGTNTRIARTYVLLNSFRDRVYIDIPYNYFEDSFVELLSCTVECRLSAGIFDLKASDKVYLQFTGRPWFYR